MPGRRNDRDRRGAERNARTRILVLCGGRRTEPDYLQGLKSWRRNEALTVKVLGKGADPARLVGIATQRWKAADDFDEVWCLVDVDEFDLTDARRAAAAAGIELAVSNPCFEIWLLLHHEDRRVAFANATEVIRRLRRHVPAYDKTQLDFADFVAGVPDAIRRAAELSGGARSDPNPSSAVWRLVKKIMEEGRE